MKYSNHPQRKPHIILSTKFEFLFGYLSGIIRQYFMARVFFLEVCICPIRRSSAILQNSNFINIFKESHTVLSQFNPVPSFMS